MLETLKISNFALISELEINFSTGLTVLTGETGAGKSIIIGALNLLLGGRADQTLIRRNEDNAIVEAVFDVKTTPDLTNYLIDHDISMDEPHQIHIRRILSKSKKNKIYINDHLSTMTLLRYIARYLVDITGQREHYSLLDPTSHLTLLDNLGHLTSKRLHYQKCYEEFCVALKAHQSLVKKSKNTREREDYLKFQLRELEAAQLQPEEEQELELEFGRVKNATKLKHHAYSIEDMLYNRDDAVISSLDTALVKLEEMRALDPSLTDTSAALESAKFAIEDIVFSIRDYMNSIDDVSDRLQEIDDRLDTIRRLKRKYSATVNEILAKFAEMQHELAEIVNVDERLVLTEAQLLEKQKILQSEGNTLTKERIKVARQLEKKISKELDHYGMEKASLKVAMESIDTISDTIITDPTTIQDGFDNVEFHIQTNVGEGFKPLVKIASGGELSRIMLAFKSVIHSTDQIHTYVFDEVDTGVGGTIAERIGRRIRELSEGHQIICITHLPQIACFAHNHLKVFKYEQNGRTQSTLEVLSQPDRIKEISRMLGGTELSPETQTLAQDLIAKAHSLCTNQK